MVEMTQAVISKEKGKIFDIYGRRLVKADGVWFIFGQLKPDGRHTVEEAPEYLQKWYNSWSKFLGYED